MRKPLAAGRRSRWHDHRGTWALIRARSISERCSGRAGRGPVAVAAGLEVLAGLTRRPPMRPRAVAAGPIPMTWRAVTCARPRRSGESCAVSPARHCSGGGGGGAAAWGRPAAGAVGGQGAAELGRCGPAEGLGRALYPVFPSFRCRVARAPRTGLRDHALARDHGEWPGDHPVDGP